MGIGPARRHQNADVEGSPILYNGSVYVGTAGGELVALDTNGAVKWIYDAGDGPIKGYVFPRFAMAQVFFSTTNEVHLVQDDGTGYTVVPSWPVTSNPVPLDAPLFPLPESARRWRRRWPSLPHGCHEPLTVEGPAR